MNNERSFKAITAEELLNMPPPSKREEVIELLKGALIYLEQSIEGEFDSSAAWRIADAGLLLRQTIESDPAWHDVIGVHRATGRGAIL